MITDAFFESSLDPLRQPPDGWDKAARRSSSRSRRSAFAPLGVFSYKKTHYTRIDQQAPGRRLLRAHDDQAHDLSAGPPVRTVPPRSVRVSTRTRLITRVDRRRSVVQAPQSLTVISRADFGTDPVRSMTATMRVRRRVTRQVLAGRNRENDSVEWLVQRGRTDGWCEPVDLRFAVDLEPGRRRRAAEPACSPRRREVLGDEYESQPRELFSLEAIPILTLPNFPFDRYPQVDVQLRYDDPAHDIRQDDVVRITQEKPAGAMDSASWSGAPAGPIDGQVDLSRCRPPRPRNAVRAARPSRRSTSPTRSRSGSIVTIVEALNSRSRAGLRRPGLRRPGQQPVRRRFRSRS